MIEYFTAAAIPKQKMFKYLSCLGKSSAKNKNITARQLLCPTNNVYKNGFDDFRWWEMKRCEEITQASPVAQW